jgi:bile acid-coenzyme A ligase
MYRRPGGLAGERSGDPLPDVVYPNANGICSSGSTGLPKVILILVQGIWAPESSFPFLAAWAPTAQPQTLISRSSGPDILRCLS